ncbi:hypothetical protein DY000_02063841 [Brassica cretica]|uniref:Uncharacterized protein n=1 Tax=Brassica cretica TaxID=69181 RepID=A0ABQ7ATJ6_BRACR|nr:hypothetical protein DY000_02063841 [Brassica cretica]
MIFGNKKQIASNGFDFVQKQRNPKKRQKRFDDDEKWLRSGDRPFTKAKRSNRNVFDQNELQTYVSLEKMLHKAIHAIRQLKKKGNANTSSAPKQHNIKRVPLPIFDDFTNEPMEGLDKEQIYGHQANQERSSSLQKLDRTQVESGRELSTAGSKHDGKTRNWTKTLNFGIMEVFDEAEGSGNIYRQADQKFTERIEIAQMNREARGVSMHESRTWCQVSSKLSVNRSNTCRRA